MKNTLIPRPAAEPPVDVDLETWARTFALSPAVTEQDRRERRIVLEILAEVEASR